MARIIRGNEFTNRSADSRYPLMPSATAEDTTGLFKIPNDLLAGLYLAVPADLLFDPSSFQITEIMHTHALCTIFIGAKLNSQLVEIGRFDISRSNLENQISKYGYGFSLFQGGTQYSDFRGRLIIGGIAGLTKSPQGQFTFNYNGAGLSVDCIRPMIRHVNGVEIETASGQLFRLNGTIRLRAGNNAIVRLEVNEGEPVVVFDAVDTSQLNEQLQCDETTGVAIRRINGLRGNAQREINLIGSRCLEVQPQDIGIELINRCSEPCASCEEAEAVKSLVDPFATQVPTLIGLINRLEAAINQMQITMLLSRGRDDSCVPNEE